VGSRQLELPPGDRFALPVARESGPVLVVHDNGSNSPSVPIGPAPWLTSLHLFDAALQPSIQHIVATADVVIAQQLDTRQSRTIGRLLQLPARMVHQLAALGPLQAVLISRSGCLLVNLVSTPTERQVFRMLG
jgi:hypothetical protein